MLEKRAALLWLSRDTTEHSSLSWSPLDHLPIGWVSINLLWAWPCSQWLLVSFPRLSQRVRDNELKGGYLFSSWFLRFPYPGGSVTSGTIVRSWLQEHMAEGAAGSMAARKPKERKRPRSPFSSPRRASGNLTTSHKGSHSYPGTPQAKDQVFVDFWGHWKSKP